MIDTFSSFYYDLQVTSEPFNGFMNLNEGSGEVTVEIPVGSYTLSTLAQTINTQLLSQATLDYTVTVNRVTRKYTIAASTNFDLLINTGSNADSSIWELIGFNTDSDRTGQNSYTSDNPIGSVYLPQFKLQSFVPDDDLREFNQATVNVAANGTTLEVINFGLARFLEMDIKFITSREGVADGAYILHNSRGLEEARDFMQYITGKREFEFNPDRDDPSEFSRLILESSPGYPNGTGYRLRELFNQDLRDIYETGILRMRIVE